MRQLNVWFVCLSLIAVSCTLADPLGGQCANDLPLGDVDCQCVSPDTRYSEGSQGYVDSKEKNLWHCSNEFGSVRVELGPSDVYACHNYKCATYTCDEDEIPNKDKLECVKKAVCGEDEDYLVERNTCVCKELDYVKIGDQCVASVESTCDTTKEVYDKSSNTCACNAEAHWTGNVGSCTCAKGYVEIMEQCVESLEDTCDAVKEVFDAEYNTCACDAEGQWTGDAGMCRCMEGYVEIDGRCVGNREESCDKPKEAFDSSHNLCVCNSDWNWTGNAGACVCQDGFVPVGKVCMKKVSCTQANETYDTSVNACICNAPYFRVNGECVASGSLAVGDLVEFGRYPQDENSDIPSPLTWQVLEIKADTVLVISQYVLEQYAYHDWYEHITWEKSNVRSYLNALSGKYNKNDIDHTADGFFKNAFGAEEQSRIKEVTNQNPNAPERWGSTLGGNDTQDKVFLLSYDEALKYFPTNKSRVASPTAYAIHPPEDSGRNNLHTCQVTCSNDSSCSTSNCNEDGINVHVCLDAQCSSGWWLRSPGSVYYNAAAIVAAEGDAINGIVNRVDPGLRPALYVRLSSEF